MKWKQKKEIDKRFLGYRYSGIFKLNWCPRSVHYILGLLIFFMIKSGKSYCLRGDRSNKLDIPELNKYYLTVVYILPKTPCSDSDKPKIVVQTFSNNHYLYWEDED